MWDWLVKTLAGRYGWNSDVLNSQTVERAVRNRMELHGLVDRDGYLQRLRSEESELLGLAQEFLVPETWFFREPDTLDDMVSEVRRRWQDTLQPVRLLSAECSFGEKP